MTPTSSPDRNDTGRIRWKQGDDRTFAVSHGYVGTIETQQFILYEPDKHAGGSRAAEWLLTSRLAGEDRMRYGGDPDDLKATAERWLSEFISSLGASFPDEPYVDPDCEECGFGLPRHDKDCSHYREPPKEGQ